MRRWLVVVVTSFLTLCGGSCFGGTSYTSPAVELHVIDQDGDPVSDALVLLTWKVAGPHDVTIRYLHIFEGRTDSGGRLSVPKWGPEWVTDGVLASDQPHLRIFKSGYLPIFDQNSPGQAGYRTGPVISVKWSSSPVALMKVSTTTDQYKKALRNVALTLKFYVDDQQCLVREAHEMVDEIRAELARVGADHPYPIWLMPNRAGC